MQKIEYLFLTGFFWYREFGFEIQRIPFAWFVCLNNGDPDNQLSEVIYNQDERCSVSAWEKSENKIQFTIKSMWIDRTFEFDYSEDGVWYSSWKVEGKSGGAIMIVSQVNSNVFIFPTQIQT